MADKLLRFKDILEMDQKEPLADPRPLSFDDLHITQYMPGEDELINYRAYRRKRTIGVGEGGPIGESTQAEENYNWKVSHAGQDVHVKAPHAGAAVKKAQKGFGNKDLTKAKIKNLGKVGAPTNEEAEVDEALTVQQRLARKRMFKRIQTKIKIGRERAKRKIASKEKIEVRAMKKARMAMFKKLTKDIPKSELTYARRQEIEKRLEKPAIKKRIAVIARKNFPKERQAELAKKRGGNQ